MIPLAADEALERSFNYDTGSAWGENAIKRIIKEHGLDTIDSDDTQREHAMLWIPGNIHQGPKSELRLQGSQDYQRGVTRPEDAPDGGDNYDVTRDDGGGNFEWSARKIAKDQHFDDLLTMKTLLEDLDSNPHQVDKLGQLFDIMSALYDHGLTLFKDTQDKWEEDKTIGRWRFKQ